MTKFFLTNYRGAKKTIARPSHSSQNHEVPAKSPKTLRALASVGVVALTSIFAAPQNSGAFPLMMHDDIAPTSVGYEAQPRISENDPKLAPFYQQRIHWKPCLTDRSPITECGWFHVPIDYAHPESGTIRVLASRVHARNPHPQGNVVMNPGGPGESGVMTSFSFAKDWRKNLGENYNFISFDPRGIGLTKPEARCLSDAEQDRLRGEPAIKGDAAGISKLEKESADFAQGCLNHLGATRLKHMGTMDVAKDLDVLRAALGDKKLNYLGFSYGTLIGTIYAEQFPHKVRSMILDGAVNIQTNKTEELLRSVSGREATIEDFARNCITKHPNECVLGKDTSREGIANSFHKLIWPYRFTSAHTSDGRPAYSGELFLGVQVAMYSTRAWPILRKALTQLKSGKADILQHLVDNYMQRDSHGHYASINDTLQLVRCADSPPLTQSQVDYVEKEAIKRAPILNDGLSEGRGALSACSYWKVPYTLRPHTIHVVQDIPIVVVSSIHDPATPYGEGVDLARQLGGRLITVQASQHTAVLNNPCTDAIAKRYFENLSVPANTTCPGA